MTVHLTRASAPLTERVLAVDELGQAVEVSIPAERALTLYVDKRELVTLMTLGAHPEWLVLGYLRNQRLLAGPAELASITVDWDAGAAAVRTRHGIADLEMRKRRRTRSGPTSRSGSSNGTFVPLTLQNFPLASRQTLSMSMLRSTERSSCLSMPNGMRAHPVPLPHEPQRSLEHPARVSTLHIGSG